ncbi:MAG: DUF4173 domain-containing protein [Bacilli bacterium]|nr:DUF4173 domain-containing protein [Bacilli bacterium]
MKKKENKTNNKEKDIKIESSNMRKMFIMTIVLCLLHSVLLVYQDFGINVLLFTIPLLGTIIYFLKENQSIKNKMGLLIIIPIILLSSTYFVYSNVFNLINILVIPFLYLLLYTVTLDRIKSFVDVFLETIRLIFKPLDYISSFYKESMKDLPDGKLSPNTKKVIKSLIIVIPVVIVVLLLLISADQIFGNLFHNFNKIFEDLSFSNILVRIFNFVILFFYLGGTLYFISKKYKDESKEIKENRVKDPLTINILLTTLNVIYIVFDIIQINSLLLHRVSSGFNYADYARSGFFQLMIISVINIVIILLSKKSEEKTYTKIMSLITVLLTLIIIVSSFYRMFLYEQAYGYTVLRLGVYIILITEVLLFIPTIIFIFKKDFNILRYYLIIGLSVYSLVNCFSIDRIIAENNIRRYDRTGDIDIYYLMNNHYDNLDQLRMLSKELDKDKKIMDMDKEALKAYIKDMDKNNKYNILEFNISRDKAKEKRD